MRGSPLDYGPTSKRDIAMLTWIRGIAALLVVVTHIRQGAWKAYGDETMNYDAAPAWLSFFSPGSFGVTLFFALSGCTLYLGYHKIRTRTEIWHFYLRRFARIYPAFLAALIAYMAFRPLFAAFYIEPEGEWVEHQFLAPFSGVDLLQYLTLTSNFRMTEELFNNAFWSLPVEFQFYLLFPLLLLCQRWLPVAGLVTFGGTAYVLSLALGLSLLSTLEMLWQFAGGMLCAHLMLIRHLRLDWRVGFALLVLLYMAAWGIPRIELPPIPGMYVSTWLGVFGVLMVFVAINIELPDFKGAVVRLLNRLGEISYSIYLFHNLFVAAWLLVALQLQMTGMARLAVVGIGTLACTWITATACYEWIEKPGMAAGKRLTTRNRAPARLDATSAGAPAPEGLAKETSDHTPDVVGGASLGLACATTLLE